MDLPKIMVMGVGNILLSDEGLGVHFLKELGGDDLPANVEVLEGGTAGLELIHLIDEVDFLIVVDAVNAKTEPGAVFRFRPMDLRVLPPEYEVSFHQVGIIEVLNMAKLLDQAPESLIFGVQPANMEWGMELTPEIRAVFPRLKSLILEEISYVNEHREFKPYPSSDRSEGT